MVEEISAVKEVEEIIYVLNGYERTTQKESVNETPVNVQHPIKVEFNFKKEGTATIYLYENANRHYLEQPYNGIYQISGDEYNSVAKFLQKND